MRKFICLWTVFMLLACAAAAPVMAEDAEDVSQLMKNKIDAVLTVLEKADMAEAGKKDKIMAIVEPVIDFELMAKLTLGKTNWARLSESEQEKFIDLFVERLKASYLDKTTLYADQEVVYHSAYKKGSKIYVPMDVETEDTTANVLYKFYSAGSQWKVYDVEINGVSLIKSYRSQFDEILRSGTVGDLFEELKSSAAE